jgi:hypothetical protein
MPSAETSRQMLASAWQSIRLQDFRQAIKFCNRLNSEFPEFAPGWHVASHLAQLIKRPAIALDSIERALKIEPGNRQWQLHRVACLIICGETAVARESLLKLMNRQSERHAKNAAELSQLAFLCSRLYLHKEAENLYLGLIGQQPENGGHWYNLATVQRFQGRLADAEQSLDKAIGMNAADYAAYGLRSDLRKQTLESNHIAELENLLAAGIRIPAGEVSICFALAKELEDTGASGKSFEVLARGAQLRRKHLNYNISDDLQTIAAIADTFTKEMLENSGPGHKSSRPVFVIGLPRTGTTLVEQILGSHPDVYAAGELNDFAIQLMQLTRQHHSAKSLSRRELVQQTARLDFATLGKAYLDSSRPRTGSTPRFVDKMPLNFLYAGLIRLALPEAKIVHLTRHPMDTCYAIYKRLFQDAYPWSYDLEEIALYYCAYNQLMTHWKNAMPGVIHELSYEDLVNDVEGQTRHLLDYCGLAWDARCLRFHEHVSVSTTASAAQVRQPVYQSSVNRWKAYESQLSPLRKRLEELGIVVA